MNDPCHKCNMTGYITSYSYVFDASFSFKCKTCNGTGFVVVI